MAAVKIANIVGARPQFIKAAVVSRALAGESTTQETIIHTGQHYDDNMSRVFFDELDIPKPDFDLGVGSGSHGVQTARMLQAIEPALQEIEPTWVVVYGDTNSTLAGALAAAKLSIGLAHVEAGLRSFNRGMPEEINRVLTDHTADLLFAPTEAAVSNLRKEGIPDSRIHRVGDVMYDAALQYAAGGADYNDTPPPAKPYVLATVHRAANTDAAARLRCILDALSDVARRLDVVLPLHPRTRQRLIAGGDLEKYAATLRLIEPVGYREMLALERHAAVIATDSGGMQKEAYFVGVPCVTLREETEWPELVDLGWNRLAPPTDPGAVSASIISALETPCTDLPTAQPYGDGKAGERIAQILAAADAA